MNTFACISTIKCIYITVIVVIPKIAPREVKNGSEMIKSDTFGISQFFP